ncbi:amino acid adenylation domain-containing protein/natural product biosynthesis luciferase-like monooxygenase protein [Stackebrandtia endophytica]|uniref:Amino acid adenylation domain-containing protein/natural product biosynthesis luciferase-like monooxygenase protein n=1 Tax=Stackebrandtia endophytica TaxID=1496996 RepID=A0A543B297_9ACTN|nr:non-ribosomal peptide synthetase [Stackebrandtia endophytica]TQL78969.1 amino acid adenylation domain-containing protein/natural product biosynthesis luciferase-like monooxygenase protein [Stackebrandtia endophytica]
MPTRTDIVQGVRHLIAAQLGQPVEDADATFFDLGADSLLLVGITRQIERDFAVRVSMRELFSDTDTPAKLAALIADRLPGDTPVSPTLPTQAATPSPPVSTPELPATPPPVTIVPVPATTSTAAAHTRLLAGFADLVAQQAADSEPAVAASQVRLVGQMAELVAAQLSTTDSVPPVESPAASPGTVVPGPSAPVTPPVVIATMEPPASPPADHAAPPGHRAGDHDAVDFSVYFFGDYPLETTDGVDKYDFIIDATRFADQHGFHAAWLPERHFHSFGGLFPNPSVLAAALARETDRIRLHAGSVVLPLHQTIRVAEEWSVVDNLSAGRAGICVASGWHANDFALFPQRYGTHRDSMYSQLGELRRLWSGEAISAVSGTGEDIDLKLYPTPVQSMPPMYAAVVGNPDSYRLAAREGLGIVTNLMTQSIEQLAERIELYRRTRAEVGLDPAGGRVVVLVHSYLGEDLATVRREAFEPFCGYMRSSLGLLGQAANSLGMTIDVHNTPEEDLRFLLGKAYERYCESRALIGTVDSCAPIVADLMAAGADEIAAFLDFGVPAEPAMAALPHLDALRRRFVTVAATVDEPLPVSLSTEETAEPTPTEPESEEPSEPLSEPSSGPSSGPLSFAQERFWLAEQLFPEHSTYNEARAVRLQGPVDPLILQRAFDRLADRHATLRTVIRVVDGQPRQIVRDDLTVELTVSDHLGQDESSVVAEVMSVESAHRFPLADGPLFRPRLLRFATDHHVLFLNAHHAIIDTVSAYRVAIEVSALYRAELTGGTADLPDLPMSYLEYAEAQRTAVESGEHDVDLAYWREHLAGDLPVLALPTDRPRPAVLRPAGASVVDYLSGDLSERARRYSGSRRSTMFMTLLAAMATTFRRLSGQSEVVIGAAIADRPDGAENLIGAMLNTIPLRIRQGEESFNDLLSLVRDTTMDGYQHGAVPFESILDVVKPPRDTSRTPLFQTLVVFENEDVFDLDLPEVTTTLLDVVPDRAIYDLAFYLANVADGVRVHAEYNTELFDESTVRGFIRQFEAVLEAAVTSPELPLPTLDTLTADDADRLSTWQRGPRPAPSAGPLSDQVARQAADDPTAIAIEHGEDTLDYQRLNRLADELAAQLTAAGVHHVVAVRLPRGPGLAVAHLAIRRHGGVCLPIDPSLPRDRVAFMLADTGCRLILTDEEAPFAGVARWHVTDLGETRSITAIPTAESAPDPGEDAAYLIFTSGSTGAPKAVPVDERGIDNACAWYRRRTELTAGTRTTITAGLGFDVFIMELWSALTAGARLVVPTEEARHDPAAMVEWLRQRHIEVAWLPTVLAEGVVALPASDRVPTRIIVTVGSALRVAPRPTAPFELVNAYGPAETSIVASHATIAPGSSTIPIGVPLPGTELYLLDDRLSPVPVGSTGEIHIGGIGVASGYLGRPELTAQRFVATSVGRLYRTGDLARWNDDGELEFLGRNDDQVKIRGFRVEPGEVTAALRAVEGVEDAVVIAEGDPVMLAAYLVGPTESDTADVVARIRRVLPDHMVPRRFAYLSALPLNRNGKVDRSQLPAARTVTVGTDAPDSAMEHQLAQLWCEELGLDTVGVTTSFFDLGGDSLAAARLVSQVRSMTGSAYPLLDFFRAPTIRAMAARVEQPTTTAPPARPGRVTGTV